MEWREKESTNFSTALRIAPLFLGGEAQYCTRTRTSHALCSLSYFCSMSSSKDQPPQPKKLLPLPVPKDEAFFAGRALLLPASLSPFVSCFIWKWQRPRGREEERGEREGRNLVVSFSFSLCSNGAASAKEREEERGRHAACTTCTEGEGRRRRSPLLSLLLLAPKA